jgi:metal-dependent amidase/aminoacylase/carboxypeptidase family protein
VQRAAQRVIGADNILTGWRTRFADDFAILLEGVPGCLILLGTANPEKGITDIWHQRGFDVDEDALGLGIEIMSLAALDLLR